MGLFILIWLACAVIAAAIGSKKNEAGSGCLLGLILGPLGILAALMSTGDRRPCPFCRELVHKEAVLCPHCRKDLPPAPPSRWSQWM